MKWMVISMFAVGAAQGQEEYDAVVHGKDVFESMRCIVCHFFAKTGPNRHRLFLTSRVAHHDMTSIISRAQPKKPRPRSFPHDRPRT